MKKGRDAEKKVTKNNLKHGTQFYGFWICVMYNLPQQPMTFWTISSNTSNRTRSSRLKEKEQENKEKGQKDILRQNHHHRIWVFQGAELRNNNQNPL